MTLLKLPKDIGSAVDALAKTREKRAEVQAKVDALKEEEGQLEAHILGELKRLKLTSARGKLGQITIKPIDVPEVKDWDKVYAFIVKHKAWALIQKRLGLTAWREYVTDGVVVPGVEAKRLDDLSFSKIKQPT